MLPMGKQVSVTYDGQGNVITTTTVTSQSGCSSGCGTIVTIVALIVVLAVPATYFPLPLAVLAYVVVGLLLIAGLVAAVKKARGGHGA
jgi:hypothetical protein